MGKLVMIYKPLDKSPPKTSPIIPRATATMLQELFLQPSFALKANQGNRKLSLETADFPSETSRDEKLPRSSHEFLNCSSLVHLQGKEILSIAENQMV